ncbi:MAG TPA: hypothetical protein VMT15_03580 [Bryobacteraceae bacterium]|nr:hypothetical protein [Bryobacteraceae bacterium]
MTPLVGAEDGRYWRRALERTSDGGGTWTETPLPYESGDFPRVEFLSADYGWIGSVIGGQFAIFRTSDGGKSWEKSLTSTPKPAHNIVDLFFFDKSHGWVIVDFNLREGYNGNGSYVFSTTDGGKTWTRQESRVLQSGYAFWVNFLSEQFGFVYLDRPALAYTSDAGVAWQKIAIRGYVTGCQAFAGDLFCTAQDKRSKLAVLTIHPR